MVVIQIMRAVPVISSNSFFFIILAWVAVDSFAPWQHLRQQKWGVQRLPRRLRIWIPRPNSVRDEEDNNDPNNDWQQQSVEWKPEEDESLRAALGMEPQKLEPRRPSIPPPDDLKPQRWKPFFVDVKRNTMDERLTLDDMETVSISVSEPKTAETPPSSETTTVLPDSTSPTTSTTKLKPLLDPQTQEEIAKAADLVREKFLTQVVVSQTIVLLGRVLF